MKKSPAFILSLVLVLLFAFPTASHAQTLCVTCLDNHCQLAGSGHGSCTQYPTDPWCKLACPNCPTQSCDNGGGGGGGGGGCLTFDPISPLDRTDPTKTVVTSAVLFHTDAATNAHVFGGRGQGYLLVSAVGFGDLTVDGAARAIQSASPRAAGQLVLSQAFTNVNDAGIPVVFTTPEGEGFGFAPTTSGSGSHLQVRTKSMAQMSRALGRIDVSGQDLLLVDVSIRGQAYILVLQSEVLDRSLSSQERLRAIEDAIRSSFQTYPNAEHTPIHEC